MGVEKITKIILFFYCISILCLVFDEKSGALEEVVLKSKCMKQHDNRIVVKHMIFFSKHVFTTIILIVIF
jgi:hypothetical protein